MPITYPTPAEIFAATDNTNVDVWPAVTWLITYLSHTANAAGTLAYFNDQWGLTGQPNALQKWKAIRRGGGAYSNADIKCLLVSPRLDSTPHGTQDRVGGVSLTLDDVVGQNAESDEALEMPWRRLVVLVNSLFHVRNGLRPDDGAPLVWNRLIFLGANRLADPKQQGYFGITSNWRMVLAPGRN